MAIQKKHSTLLFVSLIEIIFILIIFAAIAINAFFSTEPKDIESFITETSQRNCTPTNWCYKLEGDPNKGYVCDLDTGPDPATPHSLTYCTKFESRVVGLLHYDDITNGYDGFKFASIIVIFILILLLSIFLSIAPLTVTVLGLLIVKKIFFKKLS